ncbi:MAG: AhpC/TSA family protein [Beijerinckiaceae bacterium]|nr:AhpC/TSA family protein [Beijerinckiaceae bacterium]
MKELTLSQILQEAFETARGLDAPLAVRLETFADSVRLASPAFADAVDRLITRLNLSGSGSAAPAVGEPMPRFLLPDDQGHLVSLDELIAKGPVALSFHRGHWCPYCRLNTHALAQAQCEVEPIGGQIIAITPDLQQFATALKSDAAAKPFPVLTDIDNGYALSLNLAIFVGLEMQKQMTSAGWNIAPYQGNDAWILPIPATFVVGRDSLIRARFIDPDYRKRMAIDVIVDALRAC